MASLVRASIMKCTVRAALVFLGATWTSVSLSIPVAAPCVAVSLGRFLDLEALGKDEAGCDEGGNLFGVHRDNHQSCLLGKPRISVLVKIPGGANRGLPRFVDNLLK